MQFDTVIQNGTLISGWGQIQADIGITGEKITAIARNLHGQQEVDASGMLVIPGAIDPHVHLQMPVGQTSSSDDWFTGTRAAVCGGTTTVIDFVEPSPGETLQAALEKRKNEAVSKAVADYALHMTITDSQPETLKQIPRLVEEGVTSFKCYLTYEGFRLTDEKLIKILAATKRAGGLVMVHAENDAAIAYLQRELFIAQKFAPQFHAKSRPAITEIEAVTRALLLAEVTKAPIYLVHLSAAGSATAIQESKKRRVNCFAETCPQYLLLDDRELSRPGFEGAKFVCSPPLRTENDQEALWDGLSNKIIDTVGTDHCPFFYSGQKELGRDDFTKIPGGIPGIESRLALLHSFGVLENRISLERWVEVCCTAPARIFGLYPQKGTLQEGSDADIVVFDPNQKKLLTQSLLHENVDYTPYEGMELTGYPVSTFLRGEMQFHQGSFIGKAGSGRFLACQKGCYVSGH
jgi:dihydropyrimidinase